jgi:hypothetical protein
MVAEMEERRARGGSSSVGATTLRRTASIPSPAAVPDSDSDVFEISADRDVSSKRHEAPEVGAATGGRNAEDSDQQKLVDDDDDDEWQG